MYRNRAGAKICARYGGSFSESCQRGLPTALYSSMSPGHFCHATNRKPRVASKDWPTRWQAVYNHLQGQRWEDSYSLLEVGQAVHLELLHTESDREAGCERPCTSGCGCHLCQALQEAPAGGGLPEALAQAV
ncbi:unnamed protein product [Polarella glacialis]|uniref:Uncharacterized protein n=1 Tax=Polarella glacialis TaxID=89957 RepID=A0A813LTW6_POLGL|nr:unnamed protein product [Polarella glacialis]